jgi:hypothetical protein
MNRRSMVKTLAASAVGALAMQTSVRADGFVLEENVSPALAHLRSARWSEDKAFRYMERIKEVKGCNFVLSDGTSLFDEPNTALIRHKIGLASEVAGLSVVRVFVSMADFQISPDKLYANYESFLDICHQNGIHVLTVLSLSGLDPDLDPAVAAAEKPELRYMPSVHGGGYSKGGRIGWPCCDPDSAIPQRTLDAWEKLKPVGENFFRTFLKRYANDERILLWDLYNEAPKAARPVVETVFGWAREVNPSQPLSVCWQGHDLSDVITFHTYAKPGYETPNRDPQGWDLLNELDWARGWNRPMVCTEWLARPFGNTVSSILPFFERYHIGWFCWGLCAGGPAQFTFPWHWPVASPAPKEWFHCLLYPDGTPYSAEEILTIREFRYRAVPRPQLTQSYWNARSVDINSADSNARLTGSSSVVSTPPGWS